MIGSPNRIIQKPTAQIPAPIRRARSLAPMTSATSSRMTWRSRDSDAWARSARHKKILHLCQERPRTISPSCLASGMMPKAGSFAQRRYFYVVSAGSAIPDPLVVVGVVALVLAVVAINASIPYVSWVLGFRSFGDDP